MHYNDTRPPRGAAHRKHVAVNYYSVLYTKAGPSRATTDGAAVQHARNKQQQRQPTTAGDGDVRERATA